MLRFTDAVTIDLKGFQNRIYYRYCSAELEPALQSLKIIRDAGVWLEIVNLVIPTVNDDPDDIRKMCVWIRKNLGTNVPMHFSRFFPQYKLTKLPPTPVETLEKAHHIARDVGLEYVCIGNVPGHRLNSTYCPKCENILIERIHFQVVKNNIKDGNCSACGNPIPGIWQT